MSALPCGMCCCWRCNTSSWSSDTADRGLFRVRRYLRRLRSQVTLGPIPLAPDADRTAGCNPDTGGDDERQRCLTSFDEQRVELAKHLISSLVNLLGFLVDD